MKMTIKDLRKVLDAFDNEEAIVTAFDEKSGVIYDFELAYANNGGFLQLYLD